MPKATEHSVLKDDRDNLQVHCDINLVKRFKKAQKGWAGRMAEKDVETLTRNMDFENYLLNLDELNIRFPKTIELIKSLNYVFDDVLVEIIKKGVE